MDSQILKMFLANTQVVKYICFKDMDFSQEQIYVIKSILEVIDPEEIRMVKFEE
jgi:hypothetical protein